MSLFDEVQAAATEAQGVLGEIQGDANRAFKLSGKTYYGTASSETYDHTLMIGGRMVNLAKIIVATVDQFAGDPAVGAVVFHAGQQYKLVKRERDGLHYVLYLDAPDK